MAAFITCNFHSDAINCNTCINVILPQEDADDIHGKRLYPTLYLLHGYTGNHTDWMRLTSIERYARQYKLAVVIPDVHNSFYCDFPGLASGYQYWKYVSSELIEITRRFFPLSNKREDTFVAGLSMGGFGAFKCALNCPDVFSSGASLSGALDVVNDIASDDIKKESELLFGSFDKLKGGINDLFAMAQKTSKLPVKPKLYQYCGTEDFLYKGNVRFRDFIRNLGYDYTYEETPGDHNWIYWDKQIEKYLGMLNLEKM